MGKNILVPILIIIVTISIGVFGANFVYGQINSLNQKSADLKQKNEELGVKLATLEKVKDEVTGQANTSRFALPAVNATALALAQVRKIASEEEVTITSVNASGAIVEGKETNEIRLDIKTEGPYEQTKNFYLRLGKSLPLINIEQLVAQDNGQGVIATTSTLVSYWSKLPENVQGVTGTLSELSGDEINLITKLSGFEKPVLEELPPSEETPRDDPFVIGQ